MNVHGCPNFFTAKGHTHYLRAGWRAARLKITVSGTIKCRNYCEIFIVFRLFTNVAAGRGLETHDLVPGGRNRPTDCSVL
jgi:hypothetical protein